MNFFNYFGLVSGGMDELSEFSLDSNKTNNEIENQNILITKNEEKSLSEKDIKEINEEYNKTLKKMDLSSSILIKIQNDNNSCTSKKNFIESYKKMLETKKENEVNIIIY
jgi:hypothetical protein